MTEIEPKSRFRILFACMTTLFLAALDQTIVAPALPIIATEFSNWQDVSWVISAYLLVATAVIPVWGRASDIYGRRPALLTAIGFFCLGSLFCALSTNLFWLAVSRGLQALGGGGLISLVMTIVGDIFAPRERGRYQGYISGIYASAALIGPLLGGVIAERLHWSFIFWINLPLCAIAVLLAWSSMKQLRGKSGTQPLDLFGAIVLAFSIACIVLGVSAGGARWAWVSLETATLLALAAVALAVFVRRTARIDHALISRDVVSDAVIVRSILAALLVVGSSIGLSTYVPAYLQLAGGLTASQSGLALAPMLLGVAVGATLSGRSMMRVENYKLFPTAGLCLAVATTCLIWIYLNELAPAVLSAMLAVLAFGIGSLFPVSLIIVQNAASRSDMGAATSLMNLGRQLGAVLFVAGFGTLLFAGEKVSGVPATQFADGFSTALAISAASLTAALLLFVSIEKRQLRASN